MLKKYFSPKCYYCVPKTFRNPLNPGKVSLSWMDCRVGSFVDKVRVSSVVCRVGERKEGQLGSAIPWFRAINALNSSTNSENSSI